MSSKSVMKSSVILIAAATLIIATVAPRVFADGNKPAPFSGYVKLEKFHLDYEVNPDGTFTMVREATLEVLSEQGVKAANQTSFSYSESMEGAEILHAFTLKKDGRRVDVPAANIQEREAVASGGPLFSDIKAKAIIFPDVAVGDKVSYSYKLTRKTPYYPGQFSMTEVFTHFLVYNDVRIRVSVPLNSLDLKVFASGVEGGRIEDKDGRAQWVWTYENTKLAVPEYGSVDPLDYGPRIIVSSFKDYGAIAAAYEDRAKPKAAVTDKVRTLAEELTAGVSEPRERAKILYTWNAKNIHFAGNFMGIGSIVPHDAETVLANRLGDCKDHAALYQALLAAVGIESTPVMLNTGESFKLPEPPSTKALDHVITYIPSLDLYADTNSEYVPFGTLPPQDCGKPVIHTGNYNGLRQTPPVNYDALTSSMKMVIHIKDDGSADGETNIEEKGIMAIAARAAMSRLQPNMEDLLIRRVLQSSGFTGTGTLIKSDSQELSDSYAYGFKYHLNNAVNLPGPGACAIGPAIPSMHPVAEAVSGLNLPERTLDFGCFGDVSSEEYTIQFPANVTITALPKDVHLTGSVEKYDATYRRDGNTVTVVRRFEDRTKGPVCTPEDDKLYRPIAREILKDLKAQILFQPAAEAKQ